MFHEMSNVAKTRLGKDKQIQPRDIGFARWNISTQHVIMPEMDFAAISKYDISERNSSGLYGQCRSGVPLTIQEISIHAPMCMHMLYFTFLIFPSIQSRYYLYYWKSGTCNTFTVQQPSKLGLCYSYLYPQLLPWGSQHFLLCSCQNYASPLLSSILNQRTTSRYTRGKIQEEQGTTKQPRKCHYVNYVGVGSHDCVKVLCGANRGIQKTQSMYRALGDSIWSYLSEHQIITIAFVVSFADNLRTSAGEPGFVSYPMKALKPFHD